MDNIEQQNPQNPYSCIVGASLGSGKTYSSVAGSSVVCGLITIEYSGVTFTKKAAQEMRAIIGEASQLLKDKKRRQEFEGDMKCFYDGFMSGKTEHCVAPLSAQMTAKKYSPKPNLFVSPPSMPYLTNGLIDFVQAAIPIHPLTLYVRG